MAEKENPFQVMEDFYEECVEEADEKGFADMFKEATEDIFCRIENGGEHHIESPDLLDGYFIFGSGTNSVVEFHVKECPDWKFGIWWEGKVDEVKGIFFCQYEPTLDKFKPSRSSYVVEFSYPLKDGKFKRQEKWEEDNRKCEEEIEVHGHWDIFSAVRFIKNHPLRAWGADYCGYDYRYEVVSGISLAWKFVKYKVNDTVSKKLQKYFDTRLINEVYRSTKKVLDEDPDIDHYEIKIQYDECISPGYQVCVLVPDDYDEGGVVFLGDEEEFHKRWDKKMKLYDKIADILGVCYYITEADEWVWLVQESDRETWDMIKDYRGERG